MNLFANKKYSLHFSGQLIFMKNILPVLHVLVLIYFLVILYFCFSKLYHIFLHCILYFFSSPFKDKPLSNFQYIYQQLSVRRRSRGNTMTYSNYYCGHFKFIKKTTNTLFQVRYTIFN